MIFNNVKALTIPDGAAEKVSSGDVVLWEASPIFPSWYKCHPLISIDYKSKFPDGTNAYICKFSCSISGITRALINKVDFAMQYYRETASGRPISQIEYYPYTLPDDATTDYKYSFSRQVHYSIPNSQYYGHRFALRIIYTDLDGNQKMLITDYVSSVGASANASA